MHVPRLALLILLLGLSPLAAARLEAAALQLTAAQQDDPGTRQYAAAVALHNRQLYDLAADEWLKFVTK